MQATIGWRRRMREREREREQLKKNIWSDWPIYVYLWVCVGMNEQCNQFFPAFWRERERERELLRGGLLHFVQLEELVIAGSKYPSFYRARLYTL